MKLPWKWELFSPQVCNGHLFLSTMLISWKCYQRCFGKSFHFVLRCGMQEKMKNETKKIWSPYQKEGTHAKALCLGSDRVTAWERHGKPRGELLWVLCIHPWWRHCFRHCSWTLGVVGHPANGHHGDGEERQRENARVPERLHQVLHFGLQPDRRSALCLVLHPMTPLWPFASLPFAPCPPPLPTSPCLPPLLPRLLFYSVLHLHFKSHVLSLISYLIFP